MSDSPLQPVIVPLRGGLDLVSPRFAVTPGTIQDCLNYETYGIAGYATVQGLERYSGIVPPYNQNWMVATRNSGSGNFAVGEYLKNGDNYFGVVVSWDSTNGVLGYLIINRLAAPVVGDTISSNGGATLVAAAGGIKLASDYFSDEASLLEAQNSNYESLRTIQKSIYPYVSYAKNRIPHGLHWYRGRLHAIVDAYQITFTTGTIEVFPNDEVIGPASVKYGTVLSVNVTSGSWSDGNAAGTMAVRTDGFLSTNAFPQTTVAIRRPDGATAFTTYSSAFTITDLQTPDSPFAILYQGPLDDDYQTTEQINANASRPTKIWKPVDMGWEIGFTTDSTTTGSAPATVFRGEFLSDVVSDTVEVDAFPTNQVLAPSGTLTNPLGSKSFTSPASTALSTVLGDGSTSTYVRMADTGLSDATFTSLYATLNDFDFSSIPDGAVISGIQVDVTLASAGTAGLVTNFSLVGDQIATFGTSQVKSTQYYNGPTTTVSLGGNADLWGLTGATSPAFLAAMKDDPTFGVSFNMVMDITGSPGAGNSTVYDVQMKVFYTTPVTTYYAHDPITGQDLAISIPYYILRKGQFNPGVSVDLAGVGQMSIQNITPLDASGSAPNSSTWTIGTGWELRDAPDGGGTLIAIFSSQMTAATLPSRASMDRVRKRFEIITANYYANADWVAMYGVDGVGPAWQYDGYYFYNVFTALPVTEDTPSHICYHRNYNILGYENGQCIVSFPGQPTNFDPVAGSTLYPFGDRITGLLSLNGTALGVLCESSIHALAGDILTATDNNNAVSQVISPYSGAIEYCVIDAGGTPLFADYRGISTIDATDKYGDFENGRVSYQITPFLSNRVNERFSYQASGSALLFAYAAKNKNQARFVFEDGVVLTCGLPTGDRGFEFTKQQYVDSANLDTMVPVAICTGTTKGGRDVIFGTFELKPFDETNTVEPTNNDREVYVYAMDKGNRFDLAPIQHFVRLNYMNLGQPNTVDLIRDIRFEVLTNHYFNEYISMTADYRTPSKNKQQMLIDPTGNAIRIDKDSDYLVTKVQGRGTVIAIEISGENIYPGHVLQAMIVYYMAGKDQLGNSPTQSK